MVRTLLIVASLGLYACGGSKSSAKDPDGPGGGGGGDAVDEPAADARCCCETYDLDAPDIGYSEMTAGECKAQEGRCEPNNDFCAAE